MEDVHPKQTPWSIPVASELFRAKRERRHNLFIVWSYAVVIRWRGMSEGVDRQAISCCLSAELPPVTSFLVILINGIFSFLHKSLWWKSSANSSAYYNSQKKLSLTSFFCSRFIHRACYSSRFHLLGVWGATFVTGKFLTVLPLLPVKR